MDPTQAQSSFIPKKQMAGGGIARSGGLFPFIANIIFTITLIASLLVFVYQKYLESQISKMDQSLSAARSSLEPDLIAKLTDSDKRIIAANQLVNSHISLSQFFTHLQLITLQNLRFSSFAYEPSIGGVIGITMKGQARTYQTVALQAKILGEDDNYINPEFSNLDLDDKGNVIFTLKSDLNPKVISYVAGLTPAPAPSGQPASPATPGSTSSGQTTNNATKTN